MRDDGGIYTKAYGAVFYKPFTEKTGIEVVGVQAAAEPVAQIKGMVDTKTYTWDMAKISLPAIYILTTGDKKYLETHGLESEPVVKSIPAQYMSPYGVGTNIYSTVLAYRNDTFKGKRAPASWADLWNVKDVPGRRALRKHPFDTHRGIADGRRRADRAGLSVQPRPRVREPRQDQAARRRVVDLGRAVRADADLGRGRHDRHLGVAAAGGDRQRRAGRIVWDQNLWGADNWSILAGTPNANACREFIKFASDPKRMASLVEFFPAGVTQPEAFNYIKADIAKNCPTHPGQHQERREDRRQVLARQPGRGDRALQRLGPEVSAQHGARHRAVDGGRARRCAPLHGLVLHRGVTMPSSDLKITGLAKRYGSVVALAPTDLEVAKGEFLTLLGPSGSGKTTLLVLIAGLDACPTRGSVFINGKRRRPTARPTSATSALVFQNYALFPHMTVAENIGFPLKMRQRRRRRSARTARRPRRSRLVRLAARGAALAARALGRPAAAHRAGALPRLPARRSC